MDKRICLPGLQNKDDTMKVDVLIEAAKKDNFISEDCECHFTLPYGFVPEADCPKHDSKKFVELINRRAEEILGNFD